MDPQAVENRIEHPGNRPGLFLMNDSVSVDPKPTALQVFQKFAATPFSDMMGMSGLPHFTSVQPVSFWSRYDDDPILVSMSADEINTPIRVHEMFNHVPRTAQYQIGIRDWLQTFPNRGDKTIPQAGSLSLSEQRLVDRPGRREHRKTDR